MLDKTSPNNQNNQNIDIKNSASLAMVGISDIDEVRLRERTISLLSACSKISSVECDSSADTRIEFSLSSLRNDSILSEFSREDMLKNAKVCEDGYIKLPFAVIQSSKKETESEGK